MRTTISIMIAGVLLVLLFFGINLAASALPAMRIDATQGRIYTLTDASRRIAQSPAEPINLTLYYSERLARGRGQIAIFGQRIRETLQEYARASDGKIVLTIVDPEPFSDEEDAATAAGIEGVTIGEAGEKFYLGLVGVNATNGRELIPFFDMSRERFLEHDISRMIVSLAQARKRSVALVTSLPMEGSFELDPRTQPPRQTAGYRVLEELQDQFEVRSLGQDFEDVPANVDAVWLVHPTALSESAQRALNRYLMNGGRMLAMVDPNCETDPVAARTRQMGGTPKVASQTDLLEKWGVVMKPGVIAADKTYATRIALGGPDAPPLSYVAWPTFVDDAFNTQDAVTGVLTRVTMASPGVLTLRAGVSGIEFEPLIQTSTDAMELSVDAMASPPDPGALLSIFKSGGERLAVAARVSGAFTSAFSDAGPTPEGQEPRPVPPTTAREGAMLIVIADADVAADGLWMQEQRMGGLPIIRKLADNADLIANAIDNLTGSSDLIQVRARREVARPFTLVEEMRKRADEQYLAEQQLLEAKLSQAEERISQLQATQGDQLVVSPQVQKELDQVREEALNTRRQLRQVRLNLRKDVERLGTQLQLINSGLMPALVAFGGVGVAALRASRRRRASDATGSNSSSGVMTGTTPGATSQERETESAS